MKIVDARPPNFEAIAAAFPNASKPGVMFCYGDTIFAPGIRSVSASLIAHERVHSARQGNDPAGWWDRYIADPAFRFAEELVAHQAEYETLCHGLTRNQRRQALRPIAQRLAGPLYGKVVSVERAKELILQHGNSARE